jgi:hypothetical protein
MQKYLTKTHKVSIGYDKICNFYFCVVPRDHHNNTMWIFLMNYQVVKQRHILEYRRSLKKELSCFCHSVVATTVLYFR